MSKRLNKIARTRVLDEADVTLETLEATLTAAHYDCELVEIECLWVSGAGLPREVSITLCPDRKYVSFYACDEPPPYKNAIALHSLVNTLNRALDLVKFYVADGELHGEYKLTYAGGLNTEQCVAIMRTFAHMFEIAATRSSEVRAHF